MNTQPKYLEIAGELQRRITSGKYPPGMRLPGHTRLAREFGVSVITSNRALEELRRERLIVRRERQGSFVASKTRELGLISVLLPAPKQEIAGYQHYYLQGCLHRAEELGYDVKLHHFHEIRKMSREQFRRELGDGVIYLGVIDRDIYYKVSELGRPVVALGLEQPNGLSALENRVECGRELLKTMIADGCRRPGFIGRLDTPNHRLCRDGYLEGIADLNIGFRYVRDTTTDLFEKVLVDLLSPDLEVDAVIVAGCTLPIAALPVIMDLRPRSIKLGCFTDDPNIRQLAGVAYIGDYSQEATGSMAIDLLADAASGTAAAPEVRFPPYRILRPGEISAFSNLH